ncbi:SIR2 family protein [Gilvimarinus sp. SDUM040013]|uniref:SIR2 family protein n=1 Tax=Gilvimarinus gilvus TaxID=3058038 RepID=A0ABU4RUW2_9GAMM|nr:SIR2 family protein [Gilvimarinus sp. SDUM040013]MDO3387959.1 SIR2 family protein [Gilvimarinus sp. SDUM040013]MDX6848670.1 SIR2 family protein [Gilvimarinus sp. SDUM040013]
MADIISLKKAVSPLLRDAEKYHGFEIENRSIDDGDIEYSVFFQKPNEDPVPLSKPSLALFHGDPLLYDEECRKLRDSRLSEVLSTEEFPRNLRNFEELQRAQKAKRITPFVGAGSSISAGCSSWVGYLRSKAIELGVDEAEVEKHLSEFLYEDLLEKVQSQPRGRDFEFYFEQDFSHADPEGSFSWVLPELFDGCVITTNFDRVIEDCFSRQGASFTEKVTGLNNPYNFLKAITRGDRYLLKLHGNIDDPAYRVFTKREYCSAYGETEVVDMSFPLPVLLSLLYQSQSFLFLGCSLSVDRTIATFKRLVEEEGSQKVADHFAIIERPEDGEGQDQLATLMTDCNIKPIWYESGQHYKVDDILGLLLI